jgi:diguanylate cyclase (GGDEF)-like protein
VAITVGLVLAASTITAEVVAGDVQDSATDQSELSAQSVVGAFVSPELTAGALADPDSAAGQQIDAVLEGLVRSGNLLRIKVWRPDGTVVFSDLPALRGQHFDIDDDLGDALEGETHSGLTTADEAENEFEHGLAPQLVEIYLPVRSTPTGPVVAAYEIYQDASDIEANIAKTRQEVFLIAGAMAVILAILLLAAFKEVSRRLGRQNRQLRDLTGTLRESEAQLRHQSFHDPLTGLPNRALFADRVDHALARRGRGRAMPAVVVLDLDDFKTVNDTLGHGTGDGLLIEAGKRIVAAIRPGDTVCRLSGDEFAILLEEVGDIDRASEVADRVLASLSEALDVGPDLTMAASMGIAMVEDDVRDADDALTRADVAMYAAKANGKHRRERYEPAMRDRAWTRLELEAELRRGIERGELVARSRWKPWSAGTIPRAAGWPQPSS